MGPTRPRNMRPINVSWPTSGSAGVIPVESPTVPNAENFANKD